MTVETSNEMQDVTQQIAEAAEEGFSQATGGAPGGVLGIPKAIAYRLGSPADITDGQVLNKMGNMAVKGTVAGSLVTIAAVEASKHK